MSSLGPLRFSPLLKRAVWGGRRLGSQLGKTLGHHPDYSESWELVDHGSDQSVVIAGPHAGRTLHELMTQFAAQIVGPAASATAASATVARDPSFPLLIKFLDSHAPLSIQVHPDDARAARLTPPDRGKTEAWVILHAEPHAVLYAGLKRGFDRAALEREVARQTTALCLEKITPQVGDCFFIPAGTVHALGAGLIVAEVQQSSDTTYRIFDWNRPGSDGKPRPLHLSAGLEAIDYSLGPIRASSPIPLSVPADHGRARGERLVDCDQFIIDRWQTASRLTVGGDGRFHILVVLSGSMQLETDPCERPVSAYETVLIPAHSPAIALTPISPVTFLDVGPPGSSG
ncbi:MAG: type I phosphomannose isomerase catalytic subunit [Planctomycetota bacterium]